MSSARPSAYGASMNESPSASPAPPARADRTRGPSAARERLLRTASDLFYADGVRGVGVDRVIAEASVTRATFYRHFAGKEALVVAYLESTDHVVRGLAGEIPEDAGEAARWLTEVTLRIGDEVCRPGFRGCPFINAAAEFPDADSPVRRAVHAHRDWLREAATLALRRAGHPDPVEGGRRWMALRDGAMVGGYLDGADAARVTLREGVEDLVATR